MIDDTHTDFFISTLPHEYKIFRKYGNFPTQSVLANKLAVEDYQKIVVEFYKWAKRDFNSQYLPPEETVEKYIYLIEAKHFEDKKEDIAYFGDIVTNVNNNEVKIRIVQTGGILGNIYFFINFPTITELTKEDAKKMIISSIDTFLNNSGIIKELISDISEDGELLRINKKPVLNWEYQLQTLQGFMFKNTICFNFRKDAFPKDDWETPAQKPIPDKWLEYHKTKK